MNRFGFPHQQILDRYQSLHLQWLNTAYQGAMRFLVDEGETVVESERELRKRYWMPDIKK